jgi:hypothetical protein
MMRLVAVGAGAFDVERSRGSVAQAAFSAVTQADDDGRRLLRFMMDRA